MISKTATVRARIEPQLKDKVEVIFQELGLSTTEAITLFYKQVELQKGLPFELKIPNQLTKDTFEKTDQQKHLIKCENVEDLFEKLDI
jgi:DNA-damage-inducible protein J